MSIDGLIASNKGDVELSNIEDWNRVHHLRGKSDAIMVGKGTILADNPRLTVKRKFFEKNETFKNPIRVVVSSKGDIPLESQVIHYKPEILTIIATTSKCSETQKKKLVKQGCDLIICGDGPLIDLKILLKKLRNQYEISTLLLEGGSFLNGMMLTEELIDEIHLAIAPVIGGSGIRFFTLPTPFNSFNDSPYFRIQSCFLVGDMVCLILGVHYHSRVMK